MENIPIEKMTIERLQVEMASCLDANEMALFSCVYLQTENAALKEQHRWIPVAEKLPDLIEGVSHPISKDIWIIMDGVAYKGYYSESCRFMIYSSYQPVHEYQDKITHWMSIPELPKEDG